MPCSRSLSVLWNQDTKRDLTNYDYDVRVSVVSESSVSNIAWSSEILLSHYLIRPSFPSQIFSNLAAKHIISYCIPLTCYNHLHGICRRFPPSLLSHLLLFPFLFPRVCIAFLCLIITIISQVSNANMTWTLAHSISLRTVVLLSFVSYVVLEWRGDDTTWTVVSYWYDSIVLVASACLGSEENGYTSILRLHGLMDSVTDMVTSLFSLTSTKSSCGMLFL